MKKQTQNKNMRKWFLLALIIFGISLFLAQSAHADLILNGNFSDGLTSWTDGNHYWDDTCRNNVYAAGQCANIGRETDCGEIGYKLVQSDIIIPSDITDMATLRYVRTLYFNVYNDFYNCNFTSQLQNETDIVKFEDGVIISRILGDNYTVLYENAKNISILKGKTVNLTLTCLPWSDAGCYAIESLEFDNVSLTTNSSCIEPADCDAAGDYDFIQDQYYSNNTCGYGFWDLVTCSDSCDIAACCVDSDGYCLSHCNYINDTDCATPNFWNLTVIVSSASEVVNGTACPLNIMDATVTIANQTQTNATSLISDCCYSGGTYYDCYGYQFNISQGTYALDVSRSPYNPSAQSVTVDSHMGINVFLTKSTEATITLNVTNSTHGEPLSIATLYYANGTQYVSTHSPLDMNPIYTSGVRKWQNVPKTNYYYTISANGYAVYTSPIFYLGTDKSFTTSLTKTTQSIGLSVDENSGTNLDTFNFTITLNGYITPIYNAHYRITNSVDNALPYLIHIMENNYNFSVYAHDYFEKGQNLIYVELSDGSISNTVTVDISETGVSGTGAGATDISGSFISLPFTGAGWVGLFFTPFSICIMTLVGIAGYLESLVKSHGAVFIITIIVGTLAFTVLGLFPAWIGIILIIMSGAVFVYFMKGSLFGK